MKTLKLESVVSNLNLELISGNELSEKIVEGAYVSDLLSDVMGNAKRNDIWLSMQSHTNIIAVASLREISAIVITGKSKVEEKTIQKAKEESVVILKSHKPTFETAGEIYEILKKNKHVSI